jgi:hypothetical protein
MFAGRPALRFAQGVVITVGRETTGNRAGWSVPKGELVSKLQALLLNGDLEISSALLDATVLVRELQDFRVKYTDAGNATFSARGAHGVWFWPSLLRSLAYRVNHRHYKGL